MKVLLICGGRSHEHSISLKSAEFFIKHAQHDIHLLVINKNGTCSLGEHTCNLGCLQIWKKNNAEFICRIEDHEFIFNIALPMLHGPFGEDGTIQGWLELLGVPYVGCGVMASAISMDKDIAKRLVIDLGIKTADYITLNKHDTKILENINYPVFVKSANSGSSIGVSKVWEGKELQDSIEESFRYDEKIIIEQAVEDAREIEVAILESDNLIISGPGEILVKHEFYSYEAKYIDPKGAELLIAANLTDQQKTGIKTSAEKIFKALSCTGMARIDFFLKDDELFFNEINTIPGFTEVSLYPNLIKTLGISYSELIDILLKNTKNRSYLK